MYVDKDNEFEEDKITDGVVGNGTGVSGAGNSSSNSSGSKPSNSSSSNKNPSLNNDKEDNKDENMKYIFKFMNDNIEYAITECAVLDDKTCMLVLPNTIPSKNDYKFSGWSLEVDCSKDIIKESINVSSDNTYYACFSKIEDVNEDEKSFSEWILVILIWILAIFGVYRVVYNFKIKSN